jgi:hypothetical protein
MKPSAEGDDGRSQSCILVIPTQPASLRCSFPRSGFAPLCQPVKYRDIIVYLSVLAAIAPDPSAGTSGVSKASFESKKGSVKS